VSLGLDWYGWALFRVSPRRNTSCRDPSTESIPPCGVLLGAELVYEQDSVEPLLSVVDAFLLGARRGAGGAASPVFIFANSTCGRPGYRFFMKRVLEDPRYEVHAVEAGDVQRMASPAFTEGIDVLVIRARNAA